MGGRATSVENQSDSEDSEEFRVEKIVDMKTEGGKRQFLIKWKGYKSSENTWEPEANLNCKELLTTFLASRGKGTKRKSGSRASLSNTSASKRKAVRTSSANVASPTKPGRASPAKRAGNSPAKGGSASPVKRTSASPAKRESASPAKQGSASPKRASASPVRQEKPSSPKRVDPAGGEDDADSEILNEAQLDPKIRALSSWENEVRAVENIEKGDYGAYRNFAMEE